MRLFTLHRNPTDPRFLCARVSRSVTRAIELWGGTFKPLPDGLRGVLSTPHPEQLIGTLILNSADFREMTAEDRQHAHTSVGEVVFDRGGLLVPAMHGEIVELTVRSHPIATRWVIELRNGAFLRGSDTPTDEMVPTMEQATKFDSKEDADAYIQRNAGLMLQGPMPIPAMKAY